MHANIERVSLNCNVKLANWGYFFGWHLPLLPKFQQCENEQLHARIYRNETSR